MHMLKVVGALRLPLAPPDQQYKLPWAALAPLEARRRAAARALASFPNGVALKTAYERSLAAVWSFLDALPLEQLGSRAPQDDMGLLAGYLLLLLGCAGDESPAKLPPPVLEAFSAAERAADPPAPALPGAQREILALLCRPPPDNTAPLLFRLPGAPAAEVPQGHAQVSARTQALLRRLMQSLLLALASPTPLAQLLLFAPLLALSVDTADAPALLALLLEQASAAKGGPALSWQVADTMLDLARRLTDAAAASPGQLFGPHCWQLLRTLALGEDLVPLEVPCCLRICRVSHRPCRFEPAPDLPTSVPSICLPARASSPATRTTCARRLLPWAPPLTFWPRLGCLLMSHQRQLLGRSRRQRGPSSLLQFSQSSWLRRSRLRPLFRQDLYRRSHWPTTMR
jgi:hypothetical protein